MTELSILAAAREAPREVAWASADGCVTFAVLAERVRERMRELSALGESEERRRRLVALLTDESPATLELVLALFELEQPFLPLHPRWQEAEREQLLGQLPVHCLISPEPAGARLIQRRGCADALVRSLLCGAPQLVALATSGTSGAARVALLGKAAMLAAARASAGYLGWHHDDRWLLALPVAHVGGLSVITRCLMARRPVVLLPPASSRASAERLATGIVEGAATLLSLVPTQLDGLLALNDFALPPRVRAILVGGAATPSRLLEACDERGWPVLTSYGLTEACSQVATQRPRAARPRGKGIGPPLPGVGVRIENGVIHIYGPTLMTGYIGPGGQRCDPEVGFRTRDLGRLDEQGCLHVLGRVDDTIISGGENVAPAEVEAVLERCPGVLEACVFGVPDPRWGEVVAACLRVSRREDGTAAIDAARLACERQLATFKRPRLYACVTEFVLNGTGKRDRRSTAERLRPLLRPR